MGICGKNSFMREQISLSPNFFKGTDIAVAGDRKRLCALGLPIVLIVKELEAILNASFVINNQSIFFHQRLLLHSQIGP